MATMALFDRGCLFVFAAAWILGNAGYALYARRYSHFMMGPVRKSYIAKDGFDCSYIAKLGFKQATFVPPRAKWWDPLPAAAEHASEFAAKKPAMLSVVDAARQGESGTLALPAVTADDVLAA